MDNLVERLRAWADYAEKRFAAPSGNALFVGLSDHKMVREAADRIEELEREKAAEVEYGRGLTEALGMANRARKPGGFVSRRDRGEGLQKEESAE